MKSTLHLFGRASAGARKRLPVIFLLIAPASPEWRTVSALKGRCGSSFYSCGTPRRANSTISHPPSPRGRQAEGAPGYSEVTQVGADLLCKTERGR
jgi:hypothetical protein